MRCLYSDVLLRCMLLVGVSFMTACNALFLTEDAARDAIGDLDGDGYSACSQSNPTNTCDCDDNNGSIHPDADEICDEGEDNDCDNLVDAADDSISDMKTYYQDGDKDGYGDENVPKLGCTAPEGSVEDHTDCNDSRDDIHPDVDELCDGVDNDCDNLLDAADESISGAQLYYRDEDQDGYGDENVPKLGCTAPGGYVENATDCDDKNEDIKPAADELCDEKDNNCDNLVDVEDDSISDARNYYWDEDEDGYGDKNAAMFDCNAPEGYVEDNTDCNDKHSAIYPGAPERCDGDLDYNCDGLRGNLIVIVDKTKCPGGDPENCRQKGEPLFQPNEVESPGFATIQSAMDASSDGKLILVQCGITYKENINFKGKNVILMSQQGQDTTVIDGDKVSSTVLFLNGETGGAVLDGFTIQNGYAAAGGGVAVSRSRPTLRNLIVQDNEATTGGGIYLGNATIAAENLRVLENSATLYGGGIWAASSTLILDNTTVKGNTGALTGGGIYLSGSTIDAYNLKVQSNTAEQYGGGIWAAAANLSLDDTTVEGNTGGYEGGGIYLSGSTISAENLRVLENTATLFGGGIGATSSTLTLNNTSVEGNTKPAHGGGIYLHLAKISANNLKVQGNQATTYGGGIWASYSQLTFRNLLVTENESDTDGAGVSLHGVYPTRPGEDALPPSEFIHTVIANNTAKAAGGGLSLCELPVRLSNSVVAYNQASTAGNLHDYYECAVSELTLEYVNLYNPDSFPTDVMRPNTMKGTPFPYEPQFLQYKDDFPVDYHLALGGQLIDKGTSSLSGLTTELQPGLDPDGTKTDLGIYGGTYGSKWDLDLDSYPDYFWPGSYDAKADRSCYDPNDQDATTPTQPRSPTCSN